MQPWALSFPLLYYFQVSIRVYKWVSQVPWVSLYKYVHRYFWRWDKLSNTASSHWTPKRILLRSQDQEQLWYSCFLDFILHCDYWITGIGMFIFALATKKYRAISTVTRSFLLLPLSSLWSDLSSPILCLCVCVFSGLIRNSVNTDNWPAGCHNQSVVSFFFLVLNYHIFQCWKAFKYLFLAKNWQKLKGRRATE